MKIVAMLCVRNGGLYLRRCLEHLHAQGVHACIIDNGSTDDSREIAESFRGRGVVVHIEPLAFDGVFRLTDILRRKEQLALELEADWLMHYDVDEIKEAPSPWRTLSDAIAAVDAEGYNAINFDEFVFVPVEDESYEGRDYVAEMRGYYYFRPRDWHRINAWKNVGPVDLLTQFGHRVEFADRRVYPTPFVLRHYVILSRRHALAKYAARVHDAHRIRRTSWSDPRIAFNPASLRLPERAQLKEYRGDNIWDTSEPWNHHPFFGLPSQMAAGPGADVPSVPVAPRAGRARWWWPRRTAHVDPATCPLPFIAGCPRSGTTLLRLMLDAHPLLTIPPETHFLPEVLMLTATGAELRDHVFRCIVGGPRWSDFHLDEQTFRRRLDAIEPFTVPKGLHAFYGLYAEARRKPLWGDKTPGYVLHLRRIAAALPNARFIHLIRDGRDVAASRRALWWGPGDDVEAQAVDWVWRIREGRQQGQVCPHYLEVRYEHLVREPRTVLTEICAFLSLPYAEDMLAYHRGASARLEELSGRRRADGSVEVTRQQLRDIHHRTALPPTPDRIGRWRQDLTREEIQVFQQVAGPLLSDLGYELD